MIVLCSSAFQLPPVTIAHPHKTENMLARSLRIDVSYRTNSGECHSEAMPRSIIKTKLLKTKLDMLYNYGHRIDTPAAARCASVFLYHSLFFCSLFRTFNPNQFFVSFFVILYETFMNHSVYVFFASFTLHCICVSFSSVCLFSLYSIQSFIYYFWLFFISNLLLV